MSAEDRMDDVMSGDHEPTICAECRHVFIVNKSDAWYRWLCLASPKSKWFNPVNGVIAADPPYQFCKMLNNGNCEMFEPGPNQLGPDKLERLNMAGEAHKRENE